MQDAGIEDIKTLSIVQILNRLHLGSDSEVVEIFPELPGRERVDISGCVRDFKVQGVVRDVIGALRVYRGSRVYFPTLVNPEPRQYLTLYTNVAKRLCEEGLIFEVWLDDRLSVINNDWNGSVIEEAVSAFRDFFLRETPSCHILVSSQVSLGIPLDFAASYLTKVTGADLISILPYRRRYPWSTRVLDVAHFAWMCYLAQRCPGIHLAGASNKRTYQIFRQVGGKDLNVLLFQLGSEKAISMPRHD